MLEKFAKQMVKEPRLRHLVFLTATIFTVLFVGYHFGTFDQTIHLTFLKKFAYPDLYPNNHFLDLRFQHYSYFWLLLQPFYEAGILEETLFVLHLLATYATFWAFWSLSYTLFKNPLAALLTVATFAWPHVGFAGFPIFEFSLLNRTFVLPGLLLAIIWFLRDRVVWAFALLGVLYNLHVISVQFVLAMFLLACVVEFRRIGLRNIALGLVLFVLPALPVLLWRMGSAPIDFTIRPEWFSIVSSGMLYNVFFMLAPYFHILIMTFSGLAALALYEIARRAHPATAKDRTVSIFVIAVLIILLVEVITAKWLPITMFIQSQIIRAGLFILIFGLMYFAWYVADRYQRAAKNRREALALGTALVFSVPAVIPLLVWAIQRWLRPQRLRQLVAWATIAVSFVGVFIIAFSYGIWSPGIHLYGPNTAWEDAQRWALNNTPVDTLFISPPQIWGFYESEWQVFSERSTLATQSELLESAFAPEYLDYWRPRFESIAPGALVLFRGDYFENKRITEVAFYSHTSADFVRLGAQYGAAYLVAEKPHDYDLPLVYENSEYRIYSLEN